MRAGPRDISGLLTKPSYARSRTNGGTVLAPLTCRCLVGDARDVVDSDSRWDERGLINGRGASWSVSGPPPTREASLAASFAFRAPITTLLTDLTGPGVTVGCRPHMLC
jgi:hypothetical protein